MGKEAHRGPVYGAKSLLWTFGPYTETRSSGATTGLYIPNAVRVVPPYEDWLLTECSLTTSTNSTVVSGHGVYVKSEGGSTTGVMPRDQAVGNGSTRAQTIFSMVSPGGSGAGSSTWSTVATATADPAEYEGAWVPAGSSLRVVSSGIVLMAGLQLNVMGYIRYVSSTRAES